MLSFASLGTVYHCPHVPSYARTSMQPPVTDSAVCDSEQPSKAIGATKRRHKSYKLSHSGWFLDYTGVPGIRSKKPPKHRTSTSDHGTAGSSTSTFAQSPQSLSECIQRAFSRSDHRLGDVGRVADERTRRKRLHAWPMGQCPCRYAHGQDSMGILHCTAPTVCTVHSHSADQTWS